MGVYILGGFATQGPAPDGFHVPTKDEWGVLCGILTSTFGLSSKAATLGTYLKMPMAGGRFYSNSSISDVGSYGYYWSSTPYNANYAYNLYFYSPRISAQNNDLRSEAFSVRCFKDTPSIPDTSWATLYQGSGNAGVFWNSTDGLISVSGDGTTWYTIMDKNLGATTVYNQGDFVNDANSGHLYQWGNNYGFPHSGSVTTSSTQVDASNYGPGNYYSSSTFITRPNSPYDRSSVQNDNLWGGVTGVSPMSELKNAYIGEVIECDFTKSDCGFTYSSQGGNLNSYGRGSNGFWARCTTGGSVAGGASWSVPSSIYSRGTPKRVEFVMLSTSSQGGGGLGTGYETKRMRHYTAPRVIWGTQNNSGTAENPTANTEWKFTADLENKIIYSNISTPNNTLALTDNAISAFNTDWTAGNVTMHCIAYSNGYTYIKSAIFYF